MADRVRGRSGNGDNGFMLLETMVAISLITVVMAAFTTFFVNATAATNQQRVTQIGTQVANSAVETIRALPASDLVTGHDTSSVATQFSTAPVAVQPWLASMTQATDPANPSAGSGRTAAIPTVAVTQTVSNVVYSVNTYLGTCVIPSGSTSGASCTVGAASTGVAYLRAVVAVTWTNVHCAANTCTYITSTLVNPGSDPTFNLSQVPPAMPVITNPGPQSSAVGDTVNLQLASTGTGTLTWYMPPNVLPAGLSMNTTGLIYGVPTAVTPSSSITVTVTDAFNRSSSMTFTWTVVAPLTIAQPANQANLTSSTISGLTLTASGGAPAYTWTDPTSSLPPGLSLSTVSNQGRITGTPTTAGVYAVSITVTDSSGTRSTTTSFSWTITYPPFAATNPGPQTSTINTPDSVTLTVTGGSGSFAWTGGSTLPAGLTLTSAGVISGTPTTTGTKSVALVVTDTKTSVTQNVNFSWVVYAKPSVTSPGNQTVLAGSSVSFALPTTCPNSPCSYTFNNPPGTFSIDSSGNVSGTVTSTSGTYSGVYITVVDSAGAAVSSTTFVVTVIALPTAPVGVALTAGDSQLAVSWSPPTSNGNSTITGYTATALPGGATCTTTGALTCTILGLVNGTQYSVSVTATNSVGTGPATAGVNAIPFPAFMSGTNGMTLWLDGADPTTLFASSACTGTAATAAIGCWKDKSPQGENFTQSVTNSQPAVGTLNSLGAANFADTGRILNSINGADQYQTVFIVSKLTGSGAIVDLFGQANTDFNVRVGSGAVRSAQNNPNDWSYNSVDTGSPLNWANSVQATNVTVPATTITTDQSQSVQTFSASVSNTFYGRGVTGSIAEIITYKTVLTTAQRRIVEEYLARKWAVPITPAGADRGDGRSGQHDQCHGRLDGTYVDGRRSDHRLHRDLVDRGKDLHDDHGADLHGDRPDPQHHLHVHGDGDELGRSRTVLGRVAGGQAVMARC